MLSKKDRKKFILDFIASREVPAFLLWWISNKNGYDEIHRDPIINDLENLDHIIDKIMNKPGFKCFAAYLDGDQWVIDNEDKVIKELQSHILEF